MNKQMDSKQAQRLLKSLESDPRLQAPDDATILSDEQYPVAFDAAILRLKDPISGTSTVTILGWNRDSRDQHLSAQDRDRLIKQQDTVRSTLLLTPTTDNPMDEISFQHWKHRIYRLWTIIRVRNIYFNLVLLQPLQYEGQTLGIYKAWSCITPLS